jgi:hypothetical protein
VYTHATHCAPHEAVLAPLPKPPSIRLGLGQKCHFIRYSMPPNECEWVLLEWADRPSEGKPRSARAGTSKKATATDRGPQVCGQAGGSREQRRRSRDATRASQ